ncbi:MAG: hypothetical protein NXH85_00515 [Pseudomonadaceae bacterium]|nr:hypothetical protein [Pseudomonadaceae bacterium]
MDWDAIGAIGEVIGATAVMVTLAYLALQVRQNTRALRAASIDSMTNIANDIRTNLFSDPEITSIYMSGLSGADSLNDLELERFRLLMTNALWALWNAYTQAQLGENQSWQAQKPLLRRFLSQPGGLWYWNTYKNEFSREFRAEVDLVLQQAK